MVYRVLAQSFTSSQRITKSVTAKNSAQALQMVSGELEAAGFYTLSVSVQAKS